MTSIFTADTSSQTTGGFNVTKTYQTKDTPNIKFYSRSGIYNSADNVIKFFTNYTDALTIDANQNIICNGGSITNLNWNNINGKPSFFDGTYNSLTGKPAFYPTDWLSTISNKPSYFQTDWNSTIINNLH